jgi:hypothetical protein
MSQRLAERKKSRLSRGISEGPETDRTMNLSTFKPAVKETEISLVSVQVPIVGRSSYLGAGNND